MAMDEQVFYVQNIAEPELYIEDQEARHCVKVLRHKLGDTVQCVDGNGHLYSCTITEVKRDRVSCKIESMSHFERRETLVLAVAPPKNRERLEWMVEKLVEIGVKSILLLQTERTVRSKINLERLEKKMISAMKQSQRVYLPLLKELDFEEVVQQDSANRFIAHCQPDQEKLKESSIPLQSLVLIGPEGDFTQEEVQLALQKGFKALDLGDFRLRTETAAIVVASRI